MGGPFFSRVFSRGGGALLFSAIDFAPPPPPPPAINNECSLSVIYEVTMTGEHTLFTLSILVTACMIVGFVTNTFVVFCCVSRYVD